jgi:hypothetical protein
MFYNVFMQKKVLTIVLTLGLVFNYLASNKTKSKFSEAKQPSTDKPLCFTENKGQVTDQNHQARPDVLFCGQSQGLIFQLKNNGISYQLSRIDSYKKDNVSKGVNKKFKQKLADKKTLYRVDINWLNTNQNCEVIINHKLEAVDIYYVNNQSQTVNSFEEVIYKNLYNKIDLKWYEKNGELKYDYICQAGADYSSIKLNIEGAQQLSINKNGELVIKTTLGSIIEKAPLVFQNGHKIKSNWVLKNKVLSFNIENLNPSLPYIIDPAVRAWGTYYGGSGFENNSGCVTDAGGNIYISGFTDSGTSIATSGAYQTTISVFTDAFLAKFNSNGVRLWSTYYGSIDTDLGYSVATFSTNAVYLAGSSSSSVNISTPGAHQVSPGSTNNSDAFLVKFDGNGLRQWATYYGGSGFDEGYSCSTDALGNIYLTGGTDAASGTVIATSGSHQSTNAGSFNAFLAKFNSSGVRQWATYYGGSSSEFGFASCTDVSNNVYLYGLATSTNVTMVSTGCHQSSKAGFQDAFLVKFNSSGVRQWATFYGGPIDEYGYGCATDVNSNVYICGTTNSTIGIVTAACHQSVNINAFNDGFLVKFNSSGVRQWGTFYGGEDNDDAWSCAVDPLGDVYLCGTTASTLSSNIATSGSQQTSLLGGAFSSNAFLARFTSAGVRVSGTYYGSDGGTGNACASNSAGIVYLAGSTSATLSSIISTSGAHQTANGGNTDAFLAKFIDCSSAATPTNTTTSTNQTICSGQSSTLSAISGTNTINWYATPTSTTILGTGNNYTTPSLSTGTYTYYAAASSICGASLRTSVTLTVTPGPTISVNNGTVCSGSTFTIQASGASTYTYQGGSNTVTPNSNSSYTVIGKSAAGCLSQNVATCNITVLSTPTISASNGTVCSGQSFTIVPSGAVTYSLLNTTTGVPTTTNMVVTTLTSTNYIVSGTGSNGCSSGFFGWGIVIVTTNSANIAVNSGTICSGNNFTLVPSGCVSYTYQGGSSVVSPTISSQYTVAGTDNAGCTGFATASVVIETSPTINVNSGTICQGSSFTIVPSGGSSYTIQGGKATVSPTTSTNYTVTGKSSAGCAVANNVTCTVKVNLAPRMPFPSIVTSKEIVDKDETYITIRPEVGSIGRDDQITLNPKNNLMLYVASDLRLQVETHTGAPTIYTLTIQPSNTNQNKCIAIYTMQVNAPVKEKEEDLNKLWVFPDFVSPNGDGKNEIWDPTYLGESILSLYQGNCERCPIRLVGLDLLKSITVVNLFNPKIVYMDAVGSTDIFYGLFGFHQSNLSIKSLTYCVYTVVFKNGTKKTGFIGIDPTSTK